MLQAPSLHAEHAVAAGRSRLAAHQGQPAAAEGPQRPVHEVPALLAAHRHREESQGAGRARVPGGREPEVRSDPSLESPACCS